MGPHKTPGEAEELFMKQSFSVRACFDIFDQNDYAVYTVEGEHTGLSFSIRRNGEEVLKIRKKFIALRPSYTLEKKGTDIGRVKKKVKLVNTEVRGTVNGQEVKIVGNLADCDTDIQLGGEILGHLDKADGVRADCYRIRIYDESQSDLVIALAIICDNVVDEERK